MKTKLKTILFISFVLFCTIFYFIFKLEKTENLEKLIFALLIFLLSIVFIGIYYILIFREKLHVQMEKNEVLQKEIDDRKTEFDTISSKFEQVFNHISISFLFIDKNKNILDINKKFLEIFGYKKEELIGKNIKILHLDEEHYNKYTEQVYSKTLENDVICIEYEFRKKDGTKIWCEVSRSAINDKISSKNGVLLAAIDITDKIEAKELISSKNKQLNLLNKNLNDEVKSQLEKLREKDAILNQQAKMASVGEMLEAISHQWKQSLHLINLSLNDLESKQEKTNNESFIKINNQVKHMSETLNKFREFFKPSLDFKIVSIKKLIDSALVLMKDELVKYTIFTKFMGDENIQVKVIPNEFKHIIINLVNNAKDEFVKKDIKNRTIVFAVKKEENFVILKVQDSAEGIPLDIIDNIFKANITTKNEDEGNGIGLYMSKNIIEKIGGSIEVINLNNGAEFTIRIPV